MSTDMQGIPAITERIPQRPPFLFVDKIHSQVDKTIETGLTLTGREDFFQGHFPGNPIMPGVLLQEALFQSAALLMSGQGAGLGVVTKVERARFKGLVRPGDELHMTVTETEVLSNAHFFKGTTKVSGKTVVSVEFTCALLTTES